jgi:hypothetical protein
MHCEFKAILIIISQSSNTQIPKSENVARMVIYPRTPQVGYVCLITFQNRESSGYELPPGTSFHAIITLKQHTQCSYNVTLRCIHVTIVAVENQYA